MATIGLPIIEDTYAERIAVPPASLTSGQWWRQTDSFTDNPAGYYFWENDRWGYYGEVGDTKIPESVIIESGRSPVLELRRYTNNPGITRTTIDHIVKLNEPGTVGSGVDQGYVVHDTNEKQIIGGVGFQIADSSETENPNQNAVFVLRVRGPQNADGESPGVVHQINADLKQEYQWRGNVSGNGLLYGELIKCLMYTSGTPVANSVAETSVLTGNVLGTLTFPIGFYNDDNGAGLSKSFLFKAWGVLSDTGTPTLKLRLFLGGSAILDTGAITMPSGVTNVEWEFEALITCQATGVSGAFRGQGRWNYNTATAGAPSTAATTLDTTATLAIDLKATWGTQSSSNTITCTNAVVKVLAT